MGQTVIESQFAAALRAADEPTATAEERAEMLMEIAMGMQAKPKSAQQLRDAVTLYERALAALPDFATLLRARIDARMGTALQAIPDGGAEALQQACACYERALPVLQEHGRAEECAETELNLGLVIQALAGLGKARIQDAIQCYLRALRGFDRDRHAQEYAILHNNLAIAYLSIPASDERSKMREALAVQSFEEVLKAINLIDHPSEYAMIQNNLGNALQYVASGHVLENNLRALAAYKEALKVRNRRDTPVEYANTVSNMANVLRSLVPEMESGERPDTLAQALELYAEAKALFEEHGLNEQAGVVAESMSDVEAQIRGRAASGMGRLIH